MFLYFAFHLTDGATIEIKAIVWENLSIYYNAVRITGIRTLTQLKVFIRRHEMED